MLKDRKHAHYFRSVAHLNEVDIYRVLDLFGVTDQALGHAIKKLVAPGGRGAGKDFRRDVQEAIDTLTRRLEMLDEDAAPVDPSSMPVNAGGASLSFDSDWSVWTGGLCPYTPMTMVQVKRRDGSEPIGAARNFDWRHESLDGDVMACRVVGRI